MRAITEGDEDDATVTTNLGLGLFITREIVTAHGGKIKVDSSEEAGTTFTASFPRSGEATNLEDGKRPT
jgi:signal transduction histidine kinase